MTIQLEIQYLNRYTGRHITSDNQLLYNISCKERMSSIKFYCNFISILLPKVPPDLYKEGSLCSWGIRGAGKGFTYISNILLCQSFKPGQKCTCKLRTKKRKLQLSAEVCFVCGYMHHSLRPKSQYSEILKLKSCQLRCSYGQCIHTDFLF